MVEIVQSPSNATPPPPVEGREFIFLSLNKRIMMKRPLMLEEYAEKLDDTILPSVFVSPYKEHSKHRNFNGYSSLRRVIIIINDRQLANLDPSEAAYINFIIKNSIEGTKSYNPETGLTTYRLYNYISTLPRNFRK